MGKGVFSNPDGCGRGEGIVHLRITYTPFTMFQRHPADSITVRAELTGALWRVQRQTVFCTRLPAHIASGGTRDWHDALVHVAVTRLATCYKRGNPRGAVLPLQAKQALWLQHAGETLRLCGPVMAC